MGDGGFGERLRQARHAQDVHGVPGSDVRIAPGIQLTDPMNQGVGAVVRKVQRLFGVPDRHCVDVDAWRRLTPGELAAHDLSPGDLDRIDEKFKCHGPMGLHF
jgi:hypothetical protein